MNPITEKFGQDLVQKLVEYFRLKCEVKLISGGKSPENELRISTPFQYFDSTPVEIWISSLQNKLIIHENCWLYQYFRDYDINFRPSSKDRAIYDYCIDMGKKSHLKYDLSNYRFCVHLTDEDIGRQVFDFAQSLSMLSSLVLRKAAGVKQFTIQDRMRFKDVNDYLKKKYRGSNVEVTPRIKIEKINWIDDWGSIIRRRDISSKVALQFVGGPTEAKVILNTMIARQVFDFLESWSDIPGENCIVLFGGDKKILKHNEERLNMILGSGNGGYPILGIDEFERIDELLKDRLFLEKKTEKLISQRPLRDESMVYDSNIFLVVQEYDVDKDETGKIVDIVHVKSDMETLEKFIRAVSREVTVLEKRYPPTKYTIAQYHTDALSDVGEIMYRHKLENYRARVINASSLSK